MNLKNNDYLTLNSQGLFPGPQESEEAFLRRVEELQNHISLPGKALLPEEWLNAHAITGELFDIEPRWVPAFYRNKRLSFWEAAAVWDCEGRSVIQLRSQLAKGKWGLVKKEEVLAHEAAHAARMAFHKERRFEEMLCYQTSKLSWRRRLGPLFRYPWEAALCVVAIASTWCLSFFGLYLLALIIPWFPVLFFLSRLLNDRAIFKRALANLSPLLKNPTQVLAVALRLTDKEILLFARSTTEEILSYLRSQKELRWQVIQHYFR